MCMQKKICPLLVNDIVTVHQWDDLTYLQLERIRVTESKLCIQEDV